MARERTYAATERLRTFLRERLRKDGPMYQVGAQARLVESAIGTGVDAAFVSNFIADKPSKNVWPDFDQGLAICAFFNASPTDFATTMPKAAALPPPIDPKLAKRLRDPTVVEQVRRFLKFSADARATMTRYPYRRRGSSRVSNPAVQAVADGTHRKRGRGTARDDGTPR